MLLNLIDCERFGNRGRYCDGNIWLGSVTGKYKGHLGKRRTKRDKEGPARTRRDQEGPGGTTREQVGPRSIRSGPASPRGEKGDHVGPRETRRDQEGQGGPRGPRMSLLVATMSTT